MVHPEFFVYDIVKNSDTRKPGDEGPVFYPTGDIEADMEYIRTYNATVTGKYPEKQCIPSFMPGKQ